MVFIKFIDANRNCLHAELGGIPRSESAGKYWTRQKLACFVKAFAHKNSPPATWVDWRKFAALLGFQTSRTFSSGASTLTLGYPLTD